MITTASEFHGYLAEVQPMLFHDAQADFLESKMGIRGFVGGRGAGKTYVGSSSVLLQAKGGDSWMAVSPTNVVLNETTWPTFKSTAVRYGKWIRGVRSPVPKAWFRTQDNGIAEITFRSGERPDTLRGPNKAGIWLDEASIMVLEVFNLTYPTLRQHGRMGPMLLTFTPQGRHHWTFDMFFTQVDERDVEAGLYDPSQIHWFTGTPYIRSRNTFLSHCTSANNPFLPPEFSENIRMTYTEEFARQELEGEFIDIGGLLFNRANVRYIEADEIPYNATRIRYWDRAATEDGGSYTVGALVALDQHGRVIVEDIVRKQLSANKRNQLMKETAEYDDLKYGGSVIIYIEQEGGSGGKEVMDQAIARVLQGYPVYRDVVSGSKFRKVHNLKLPGQAKITRAAGLAAQFEAGNVYLKRAPWNKEFLDEFTAFPESTYSDQVDSVAGAFNKLALRGPGQGDTIQRVKTTDVKSSAAMLMELQKQLGRKNAGKTDRRDWRRQVIPFPSKSTTTVFPPMRKVA